MKRQPRGKPRPPALKGRAPRVSITMRVDPDLLKTIRRQARGRGRGYQSYMHELLAEAVLLEAVIQPTSAIAASGGAAFVSTAKPPATRWTYGQARGRAVRGR